LPTSAVSTTAPRASQRHDDPLGIRAHEEAVRRSAPRLGGGGRRRTYHVDDVTVDSYIVVRAPEDREDNFALWVEGVPLWIAKVLRVDDDNAKWCVNFFRGKGIGDEIRRKSRANPGGAAAAGRASQLSKKTTLGGAFEEVQYRNVTDGTLSADQGSLVVVFDGLLASNKLKHQTVKEIVRVLRAAATLSAGQDGNCAACHEPLVGDAVPECGCCARQFHRACIRQDHHATEATWWCADCRASVPVRTSEL